MTDAPFTIPILRPMTAAAWRLPKESLTFVCTAEDRAQCERNHYQSLERVRERGGLSWRELAAVLEHRPFREMPMEEARAICQRIAWERNQ